MENPNAHVHPADAARRDNTKNTIITIVICIIFSFTILGLVFYDKATRGDLNFPVGTISMESEPMYFNIEAEYEIWPPTLKHKKQIGDVVESSIRQMLAEAVMQLPEEEITFEPLKSSITFSFVNHSTGDEYIVSLTKLDVKVKGED